MSNRPGKSRSGEDVNLSESERQLSMIGGTVLAVCGLLRGSVSGLALAALGGAMIYRGHTGHCQVYEALEYSSREGSGQRHRGQGPKQPPTRVETTV